MCKLIDPALGISPLPRPLLLSPSPDFSTCLTSTSLIPSPTFCDLALGIASISVFALTEFKFSLIVRYLPVGLPDESGLAETCKIVLKNIRVENGFQAWMVDVAMKNGFS